MIAFEVDAAKDSAVGGINWVTSTTFPSITRWFLIKIA